MSFVGLPVLYRAHPDHYTKTEMGLSDRPVLDAEGKPIPGRFEPNIVEGSVHHRELTEFAGHIVRENADGTFDLNIFPPGQPQPVKHLRGIALGDEPGTFSIAALPDADATRH